MLIHDYLRVLARLDKDEADLMEALSDYNRSSAPRIKALLEETLSEVRRERDAIHLLQVDSLEPPYDPKEDDE